MSIKTGKNSFYNIFAKMSQGKPAGFYKHLILQMEQPCVCIVILAFVKKIDGRP